jgi:hypothetical protein
MEINKIEFGRGGFSVLWARPKIRIEVEHRNRQFLAAFLEVFECKDDFRVALLMRVVETPIIAIELCLDDWF